MIKKCKQCGSILKSNENNKICDNCRTRKKNAQEEVNSKRKKRKSGDISK